MWMCQLQIVIYFIFLRNFSKSRNSTAVCVAQTFPPSIQTSVKFSQLWRAFSLHVSNVSLSNWAKLLILRRYLLSSGVDGFAVTGTCQKLKKTVVLSRSIWEQLEHTWDTTSQRKGNFAGAPSNSSYYCIRDCKYISKPWRENLSQYLSSNHNTRWSWSIK